MLTLDPIHPSQSAVLEILIERPGLKTSQIKKILEEEFNIKTSQPTLHRLTTSLLESHMLVKTKGRFWINYLWGGHIQRIAQKIEDHYFTKEAIEACLGLKPGETQPIEASSLKEVDPLWNHTLVALKEMYVKQPILVYSTHPAYAFPILENEKRLLTSCREKGGIYRWFGGETFLDKKGAQIYEKEGVKTHLSAKQSFSDEVCSIWICGEYIVKMVFPDQIAKYMELVFNSVKSEKDFDPDFFKTLYESKSPCTLSVTRDKAEVEKYLEAFKKVFKI